MPFGSFNWGNLARPEFGSDDYDMPQFNYRMRRVTEPFAKRLQNVEFNSPQSSIQQEPEDLTDLTDFSKFYDEPGPAMTRYQQHLGEVPNVEDYAPSKWRRLGAILSGVNSAFTGRGDSYERARDILLDPYRQAYERWGEQGAGLRESANMESDESRNRANFYQKVLSDMYDRQDKLEQRKIGWAGVDNSRERNDIARFAAEQRALVDAGRLTVAQAEANTRRYAAEGTRQYQQGMLGLGRERNELTEQDMFSDALGRSLDRASNERIANMRGDTGISGTEQKAIIDGAIFDMSSKYGREFTRLLDPKTGLPRNALPPEMAQTFETFKRLREAQTSPRYRR